MAHVKALNKKKNLDDAPDSPHHTPITGRGRGDGDSDDDEPAPPPKKKKKLKPMPMQAASDDASDSGAGGSSGQEVEIVFKLHPKMSEKKELMQTMKGMSTRFIKTTAKALVEHLAKYLAMRISLDLPASTTPGIKGDGPPTSSSASSSEGGSGGGINPTVKDLTIFIAPTPGQMVELSGSMSLTQVNEKYWKVNKPMEMFYSFQRS
jgi:E3 ubiquitin-protein ligase RNF1/2